MPSGYPQPWQDRFWLYVSIPETDDCWEWTGSTGDKGYGQLMINKVPEKAHRLSWRLHNGDIPDGLWVLHSCDNPLCIRYDHLFLGTNDDNMKDASRKRRMHEAEANGMATLTWEQVLDLRYDRAIEGLSYPALGKRYNVATMTAWNIVNKVTWKD